MKKKNSRTKKLSEMNDTVLEITAFVLIEFQFVEFKLCFCFWRLFSFLEFVFVFDY